MIMSKKLICWPVVTRSGDCGHDPTNAADADVMEALGVTERKNALLVCPSHPLALGDVTWHGREVQRESGQDCNITFILGF